MTDQVMQAGTLGEAIPLFRRPFTPAAVKFKVQVNPRKKDDNTFTQSLCVGYVDSRLVAERLNAIVPGAWSDAYGPLEPLPSGWTVASRLTVFATTREDVGFEMKSRVENEKEGDMAVKGLYSDAFKRAAVKFGIGAFLYAMPPLYIPADKLRKATNGKFYMSTGAEGELRKRYTEWLGQTGTIDRFGVTLDHGDVEDASGDAEPVSDTPVAETALKALKKLYADSKCTKAVWQAQLTQMGLSNVSQATEAQVGELTAFLEE